MQHLLSRIQASQCYPTNRATFIFLIVVFYSASTLAATVAGHVEAWGSNTYGETSPPSGLDAVIAVSGGGGHSLALLTNGMVIGWGNNDLGQANPPSGLNNVIAISAGHQRHSLALKKDGTVVGWGNNAQGQLNVPAGLNDVRMISAGDNHTLAVRANGSVVAWGLNSHGQTDIPIGLSNVVAVAAGTDHSLAVTTNGTVVGWGNLNNPNLNIPPGLTSVVALATHQHTLALRSDGTVSAWGLNFAGQTDVPAGLADVMAVEVGNAHSLALKRDGTVVAWGFNRDGQATVPAGLHPVVAIDSGGNHNLIVTPRPLVSSISPPVVTNVGALVTFAVAASGEPLTYQWQHNDTDLVGETNSSITLTNVQVSDRGRYAVLVGNTYGTVLSPSTSLSFPPPNISAQPQNLTRYRGDNALFDVTADGLQPLTYQWRKAGIELSGETAPTLVLTNLRSANAGDYHVVVMDVVGSSTTSIVATLTVIDPTAPTSVMLTPVLDTSIFSSGVNPRGIATILAGTRNNGIIDRGLLQFDLSSISPKVVLRSVSLRLSVLFVPSRRTDSNFGLYRMFTPWGEDATWANARVGMPWTGPGGMAGVDYALASSVITFVSGLGVYDFDHTEQLAADMEAWRADSSINYGWLLKTESEATFGTARHFGSSESGQPPLLLVQYNVPASRPHLTDIHMQGDDLSFQFEGEPGWIYRVESRDDVNPGPWSTVTTVATGSSPRTILVLVPRNEAQRFYRVIAE